MANTGTLGRIQHLPGFVDGHRQRFLAEHVQAALHRCDRQIR